MWWIILFVGLLLSTCGAPAEPLTGHTVLYTFKKTGARYTDAAPVARTPDSPLPNSYTEHVAFLIPGPPISGGEFFVCATKSHCDQVFDYLTKFIPIGPPDYYFQSRGGRVVVHLSSNVAPDTANTFARAITPLP